MVGRRKAVLIDTPSKVVCQQTNKPSNVDKMDDDGIISFHDGSTDNDMLR